MKTSRSIIISSVIIFVGIVFYSLSNRYYIDTSTKLIVDRLTGKVAKAIPDESNTPTPKNENVTLDRNVLYEEEIAGNIDEYNKKLDLFIKSESMVKKFTAYYDECIKNIKDNPLYYDTHNDGFSVLGNNDFTVYSPLFRCGYIQKVYNEEGIDTYEKYIDFIKEKYKTLGSDKK